MFLYGLAYSAISNAGDVITVTYDSSCQAQTISLTTGSYELELFGASGGNGGCAGGNAGYARGILNIYENTNVYVTVGGEGNYNLKSTAKGGCNGGGDSKSDTTGNYGSGGGATDIRITGQGLNNRIIVAAGGGGGGNNVDDFGGFGGGSFGGNGYNNGKIQGNSGTGANQNGPGTNCYNSPNCTSGSFGEGGGYSTANSEPHAGGGGGLYGGSSGNQCGAGGGSGFVYTHIGLRSIINVDPQYILMDAYTETSSHTGNGNATIKKLPEMTDSMYHCTVNKPKKESMLPIFMLVPILSK